MFCYICGFFFFFFIYHHHWIVAWRKKKVKKKKKKKAKTYDGTSGWGTEKAPPRARNSRLVNLREWSWSRLTVAFFNIYCCNSQQATQSIYQQIPHRNRTKSRLISNTRSIFNNSQSRNAHKRAPADASHPRKVVMEMGHSSSYSSHILSLNLVDIVSRKALLLKMTVQKCPEVLKPNIFFFFAIKLHLTRPEKLYL